MLGYDRVREMPLLLRRRGASPRRFGLWLLGIGVVMVLGALPFVGGELEGLGFSIMPVGGLFAIIGAHTIGAVDGTAAVIVQQPLHVEMRTLPPGPPTLVAGRVLLPAEDVRRIEVHAVPVTDRHGRTDPQGRFVVAIVARTRLVELTFLGGEEAREVAGALHEQLSLAGDVVMRQRPNFRKYAIAGGLVVVAAIIFNTLCWGWMLFSPHDVVGLMPPLGVMGLGMLALYFIARWAAPDAMRRMAEVEYGVWL